MAKPRRPAGSVPCHGRARPGRPGPNTRCHPTRYRDARLIGDRSDAVLRTAAGGQDGASNRPLNRTLYRPRHALKARGDGTWRGDRARKRAGRRRGLGFSRKPAGPYRRPAESPRRQPAARWAPCPHQGQAAPRQTDQRPLRLRPPDLLVRRSRPVGDHLRDRHHGLDRSPPAADPVARNSQAPALGPDHRRQRRHARHARRHGRCRGAVARVTRLRAQGLHRHRGSPLLRASRRRPIGNHPSADCRRAAPWRLARRLDHHPAARQESVPDPGAHHLA